jgi:hypothetical protein
VVLLVALAAVFWDPLSLEGSNIGKGGGASGYDQIQDEGVNLPQRTILDFSGAGVTCVDSGGIKTLCPIPGGGAAVASYEPQEFVVSSAALNSVANTVVLSESDSGQLLNVGIRTTSATVTGTPTAVLKITVDGGTTRSYVIWNGSTVFNVDARAGAGWSFSTAAGNGATVGDFLTFQFYTTYTTSILVEFEVTAAASSASTVRIVVLRALELP